MAEDAAPEGLWAPTAGSSRATRVAGFACWVQERRLEFGDPPDYDELWRWSVEDPLSDAKLGIVGQATASAIVLRRFRAAA